MSIALLAAAWDLDIGSTEKMVLMCLCDHANDDGVCWPSVARICKKTSKSERTVQAALKWLRENGYYLFAGYHGPTPKYQLDPSKICTPANFAPPQKLRKTPAESAPKPLRTTKIPSGDKSPSGKRAQVAAHSLPANWEPQEFGIGSKSRALVDGWPPGEYDHQLEHFRAHHTKKADKFSSWQDAWKTWVLNSRNFRNGSSNFQRSGGQGHRQSDGFSAVLREVASR